MAIVHLVFPKGVKVQPATARDDTSNLEILRGETPKCCRLILQPGCRRMRFLNEVGGRSNGRRKRRPSTFVIRSGLQSSTQ